MIKFIFSAFIWTFSLYSPARLSERLCGDNEEIIISFKTKGQGKVATICKEKTGKYLVYRFGTKENIELQLPGEPDSTSWTYFSYTGQWRFGGKANAGFGDLLLEFKNVNATYRIFQVWSDEDNTKDFGIEVETGNGKKKKLAVNKSSLLGSLMRLNDLPQIKNHADD